MKTAAGVRAERFFAGARRLNPEAVDAMRDALSRAIGRAAVRIIEEGVRAAPDRADAIVAAMESAQERIAKEACDVFVDVFAERAWKSPRGLFIALRDVLGKGR